MVKHYLHDSARREFIDAMKEIELKRDTVVIRAGDPGHNYFFIRSGTCAVEVDGHVVRTLGPGGSFGELALISREPRSATVFVSSDVSHILVARQKHMRRTGLIQLMGQKRAEWLPFLRSSFPLIAQPLSHYELTMLVDAIDVQTYHAGECLTVAGERRVDGFFMLAAGSVDEVEVQPAAAAAPAAATDSATADGVGVVESKTKLSSLHSFKELY